MENVNVILSLIIMTLGLLAIGVVVLAGIPQFWPLCYLVMSVGAGIGRHDILQRGNMQEFLIAVAFAPLIFIVLVSFVIGGMMIALCFFGVFRGQFCRNL